MTKPAPRQVPAHISKREAIMVLGCSMPTLESLINTGQLPAYRLGPRSVRLKLTDVEGLLRPVTLPFASVCA
jgi:excisionase family DNA binding protein